MNRLLACLVVVALSACTTTKPSPELLVVVDSDIADLTDVTLDVTGPGGAVQHQPFHLDTATRVPLSLAVVPKDGDATRLVTVRATGLTGGTTRVSNYAITSFVPGEVRRLDLFLGLDCTDPSLRCEERMLVCRAGACVSPNVDASTLPRVDVDAGDSGPLDAATDAPADDASHDAGATPDGWLLDPVSGEACDASAACGVMHACTSFRGEAPVCRRLARDPDAGADDCASTVGHASGRDYDFVDRVWVCTTGCDPLVQTGCPAGEACDEYSGDMRGNTDCRPIGPVGTLGYCTSMESCGVGLNCYGTGTLAFCTPFCDSARGVPCAPGSDCGLDVASGVGFCIPRVTPALPCNPDAGVGGDAGCPGGLECATGTRGAPMCKVPCDTSSPASFCVGMVGRTSGCEYDAATSTYHCTAACDPALQLGCPTGTACDIFPAVITDCRAASPAGTSGAACTSIDTGTDCAVGFDCDGPTAQCWPICTAGDTCATSGATCGLYSGTFPDGMTNDIGTCH